MKTLSFGVIGAGFVGKAQSLAYAAIPMSSWPPPTFHHRTIGDRAEEAALHFGFEPHDGDRHHIVEDDSIDIIDIATNVTYLEIAAALDRERSISSLRPRTAAPSRPQGD